jgi:hypothetical protein
MSEKTGAESRRADGGAAAGAKPAAGRGRNTKVLGQEPHLYELVEGWGQLPAGVTYGFTHGVQVDSANRVIIHNRSKDSVIVFDEDGRFVKSWGPEFQEGAHGCLLRRENGTEYLYLSDPARHLVAKTTTDGEPVWTLGYPKETGIYSSEDQFKPTNVAVGPDGDIYVADGYGLSWIHQYHLNLEYVRSWGGKGSAPGKLDCPHGIWIDQRGASPIVMVADRANVRLQMFTLDGQHLGFVTEGLRRPCHFDERGGDLLVPDLHGVVTIFDRANRPIAHLGDNPGVWDREGWPNLPESTVRPDQFISPHGACWDHEGDLYVVEWIQRGRVTKLRRLV